jgi:hypothetical protein
MMKVSGQNPTQLSLLGSTDEPPNSKVAAEKLSTSWVSITRKESKSIKT